MLHSNICSSSKKITDFKYYINNFNLDIAFIGLCETWATKFNQDLLNIPGYRHEQCIRSNKKKGGGTSLYIHNTIQYKKREDLTLAKTHYESTFVEIDKSIFKTNRNVIIGEIYKPPSTKIKSFNIELDKLLSKINKEKKYAFLMGDYNINTLSEINISKHSQEFINILSTYYYHKLISLPSRHRNKSCTLIDNIYTNIPDCYNTCSSGVLKFMTQLTTTLYSQLDRERRLQNQKHSDKNIAKYKKIYVADTLGSNNDI